MMNFELNNNIGYYEDSSNLISFQLGADTTPGVIDTDQISNLRMPIIYTVGDNKVLIKGTNNLLPEEIQLMVGNNRLLPELIEKQVRIQYGKGLYPFKKVIVDGKPIQQWEEQKDIQKWLDSWQINGLQDSSSQVVMKIIRDFYYFEDYFIKWRYAKSRRTGGEMPVVGLEYVDNRRCRLATSKDITIADDPEDSDFDKIIVGNWKFGNARNFKIYERFLPNNPLNSPVAMSYHKNASVGKIYGENKYYAGIKEWLVGMNRNPRYINSFLKNSLSAKIHLIIPREWLDATTQLLKDYCDENQALSEAGGTLLKPNGVDIGTKFSQTSLNKYIKAEMQKLSVFLSGAENQGKLFATYAYTTEEGSPAAWKLEPIDLKYKEYISTLNDNDKRADEVTLAAKGLDASISSISKDGIISKSGSDLYYNYVIYLHNLTLAEQICTEAFNTALRINFPNLYMDSWRLGFYNEVPAKQEDVAPNDRLQNTMNNVAQSITQMQNSIVQIQNSAK